MKTRICILFIIVLITTACSSVVNMTSEKMNKLELGMSKQQVTEILGSSYTICMLPQNSDRFKLDNNN